MKTTINDFKKVAKLVKSNKRYDIYDYCMKDLVVSMTIMKPEQETRGHSHKNIDEVYICLEGKGEIEIEKKIYDFKENDIVTIPEGKFHKVKNKLKKKMAFLSVFEKYKRK